MSRDDLPPKTRIANALGMLGLRLYQRMLQEGRIDMRGTEHDIHGFFDPNGDKGELIFDQICDEIDAVTGRKARA